MVAGAWVGAGDRGVGNGELLGGPSVVRGLARATGDVPPGSADPPLSSRAATTITMAATSHKAAAASTAARSARPEGRRRSANRDRRRRPPARSSRSDPSSRSSESRSSSCGEPAPSCTIDPPAPAPCARVACSRGQPTLCSERRTSAPDVTPEPVRDRRRRLIGVLLAARGRASQAKRSIRPLIGWQPDLRPLPRRQHRGR